MKIDIMLPFYGDVALMKETVESVLVQSNPNWRLTVIDDGYPDPSVAAWFGTFSDERVRYFRNEVNLGANGNYRRAVELAEEELCLILGADDLLGETYVENIFTLVDDFPNGGFFHPGISVINEHGSEVRTIADAVKTRLGPWKQVNQELHGEELAVSLMHGNWMYFPSITWKTEVIKKHGFREGLNVCQDLGLAVDLIISGHSLILGSIKTFSYRRHSLSDSSVRAIRGDRFAEESSFFNILSLQFEAMGWKHAARAARLHLSSRLHALCLMPRAIFQHGAFKLLVRHVFI